MKKILILTASIGSGHISVAHAIEYALKKHGGSAADVKIVDFISAFKTPITRATKGIYLGSLKISPKIWELLFSGSSNQEWPVKFLNTISAPFMQKKFLALLAEYKPSLIVSTFPLWELLLKKTREEYLRQTGEKCPLVTVVTDSISIHRAWTLGDPDFFMVANDDTKISLGAHGVAPEKIKVFGYPISHSFRESFSRAKFLKNLGLSPDRKTLLLILASGTSWLKINKIIRALKASGLKRIQLIIIDTSKINLRSARLKNYSWPFPAYITGWTDQMHTFIRSADIVLTKAGGSTVMECINSDPGVPMLITDVIPGQEMGNALLVEKYNLGVVMKDGFTSLDEAVSYILNNESLIRKNIVTIQKPHAAADIAGFLLKL